MTNLEWIKEKIEEQDVEAILAWHRKNDIDIVLGSNPCSLVIDTDKLDIYLAEHIEEPKTIWDLKDGDEYFTITNEGNISISLWSDGYKYHINRRNQGNAFLTKEEAEFEIRRREVYTIAKKYSHKFNSKEWNDVKIGKWAPYYCMIDGELKIVESLSIKEALLYFKSKDDVEKAINEVGKEDFIKYYLGVDIND